VSITIDQGGPKPGFAPVRWPGLTVLRSWTAAHPEWWSLTISFIAGWLLLSNWALADAVALCQARETLPDLWDNMRTAWNVGAVTGMGLNWFVMALAMVPPLTLPLIRHVAARSFTARRDRSVALFLAGVIGVWLCVGLVLTLAVACWPPLMGIGVPGGGAAMIAAAIWQVTPMKRRALRRCHRTFPLMPWGWRADCDCIRHGLRHGLTCVANCWALMCAAMLTTPALMPCVLFVAMKEQQARLPRPGVAACVMAGGATVILTRWMML
jgi:predicted metal-binding membrane protein